MDGKQKLILTKGLPASGKTTWAKQWVNIDPDNRMRINRDDIRSMIGPFPYDYRRKNLQDDENRITEMEKSLVQIGLVAGKSVALDNTHLNPKYIEDWKDWLEEFNYQESILCGDDFEHVQFEVNDYFLQKSIEDCIADDMRRPKKSRAGAKVIFNMYKRYIRQNAEWNPEWSLKYDERAYVNYEEECSLPDAIICDLDGTLSLMNGRSPYKGEDCATDLVHKPVLECLQLHRDAGIIIILVSGRNGESKPQTIEWLTTNQIPWDYLHMRKPGDQRADDIIKREMFQTYIEDFYNPLYVLDDRNQVVDMWRKGLGIPCFQVWYGDF